MSKSEQLAKMLESSPDDLFLRYAYAMACSSEGDNDTAADRLAAINESDPDHVAAWFQRGKILNELGESDEARDVLTNGITAAQRVGDDHAEEEMRGFLDLIV
jgi:thioredoxin-like negative regulator of GroEL